MSDPIIVTQVKDSSKEDWDCLAVDSIKKSRDIFDAITRMKRMNDSASENRFRIRIQSMS